MRKLAYQWLATNHRRAPRATAGRLRARRTPSRPVTDNSRRPRRARHVPGAALPRRHHAVLGDASPTRPGNPTINGALTWTANFICVLPSTRAARGTGDADALRPRPARAAPSEVEGGSFSAGVAHDLMGCATDWVGMSENDIGNVARNLQDMSTFDTQVDHMLQGFVNFQFLGRLINSSSGFVTDAAFQTRRSTRCSRRTTATSWATARAGSWAVRCRPCRPSGPARSSACPGMDYGGVLLNRSVDWNEFSAIFDVAYTDPVDQQIVLQLAQLLWDRGENEGYAEHLTSQPVSGHTRQAGVHHRELRRPPGGERRGRDAGADDRRAEPPARVRPVVLRRRAAARTCR